MKVLLTGGTGFVGGQLARALLDERSQVRCLVRESSTSRSLDGLPVERAPGDLVDRDSLREAIRGCEVVYHCAADYRLYVPDPESMYASNVEGTRNVMELAAELGVKRVVYTSTVGALGFRPDGSPADETTLAAPGDMVGHYKRSKYQAERVAEEWAGRGLSVVIVSPTAPVGERDVKPTATGGMILDYLRGRMPAYVDTGLNLVDVRDVARGHILAAARGRTGERYILGHRNMTLKEIFDALARITGVPAPRVRLPHWVALAVAAVDTSLARLRGRPPRVAMDAVKLSRHSMFFDVRKAVRELDLPQTPVEQALERAVVWFREQGYVERGAAA